MQTETQNQMLKNILDQGTHITPIDALNMIGTMRLAARVFELKQSGYPIDKYVREVNGKRVTYYFKANTMDDYDDGQPSESQEWYDYDPDC